MPYLNTEEVLVWLDGGKVVGLKLLEGWIYYKLANKRRAKELRDLMAKSQEPSFNLKLKQGDKRKSFSDAYHTRVGRLLGYTEREIKNFLHRIRHIKGK